MSHSPAPHQPPIAANFTAEQKQFLDLLGPLPIVEGEQAARYHGLLASLVADVNPVDMLEWIWIRDIVDLQWEVLRYRRAKAETITSAKHLALGVAFGRPLTPDDGAADISRAISNSLDALRRLDHMITSCELRRDNAYHEAERRRAALGKRLRHSVEEIEDVEFRVIESSHLKSSAPHDVATQN